MRFSLLFVATTLDGCYYNHIITLLTHVWTCGTRVVGGGNLHITFSDILM